MAVTRVTTDGITDSAVNSAKIGVDVIAAEDLAANSVTVAEIQDGAVSTAKVADGAVTHAKLHSTTLNPITLDQSNNRVGIGAASPQARLEVREDVAGETGAFIVNPNAGGYAALRIGNSDRHTNGDHLVYGGSQLGLRSKTGANITFEPANNIRMTITPEGYVTTPNQPMVRMSLGSHFGTNNVHPSGPGGKITGFTVHENIGSHWNNSNSQFTCPVAGVYCVAIFWIKYPAGGAAHVDLHKNGSAFNAIRWRAHEGGSSYHQVGGTVFVTCAANDVLEFRYFGAPGIHDGNGQWGIRLVG